MRFTAEKSNRMKQVSRILTAIGGSLILSACGSVNVDEVLPDKSVEYKREVQADRNLEIPPDLTSSRVNDRMSVPDNFAGVATNYSEYMVDRRLRGVEGGGRTTTSVLPENPRLHIERDGDVRWLVVQGDADAVWDRVLDFWQDQGVLLEQQDPELGIMQTAWLENRATISRDFITDAVRSVFEGLYETSLRDAYRLRFERAAGDQTEVYLTHYGMEEKLITGASGQGENTVWTPRERDPELEVVMLRRLMVFLGAADERARAELTARAQQGAARSQLVQGRDGAKLVIGEEFSRSWRIVGLALDRVGFAVEDRDRSQGLYYVRYNDPAASSESGGLLSSLAFWESEEDPQTQYRIKLALEGQNTVVTVLDGQGQRDRSDTAKRILNLLREQIR